MDPSILKKAPAKLILLDGTVIPETKYNSLEVGVSAVTVYRVHQTKIPYRKFWTKPVTYKFPALTIPWHLIKEIDWGYQLPLPVARPVAAGTGGKK